MPDIYQPEGLGTANANIFGLRECTVFVARGILVGPKYSNLELTPQVVGFKVGAANWHCRWTQQYWQGRGGEAGGRSIRNVGIGRPISLGEHQCGHQFCGQQCILVGSAKSRDWTCAVQLFVNGHWGLCMSSALGDKGGRVVWILCGLHFPKYALNACSKLVSIGSLSVSSQFK